MDPNLAFSTNDTSQSSAQTVDNQVPQLTQPPKTFLNVQTPLSPTEPAPSANVVSNSVQPNEETYIENVGSSMIDLLKEIDKNEGLIDEVAKEMQIETAKAKEILTGLLNKIEQKQVTKEELALILASPVVEEPLIQT